MQTPYEEERGHLLNKIAAGMVEMEAQMALLSKNLENMTEKNADFVKMHQVWKQFMSQVQRMPKDDKDSMMES